MTYFEQLQGKKYLIYKAIPINVAIIRGTTADSMGNISMERESVYADNLIQAMAARASGGLVLAQVERVACDGSLRPRQVRIPGTLVDGLVVARPENHWMSYATRYHAGHASDVRTAAPLAARQLKQISEDGGFRDGAAGDGLDDVAALLQRAGTGVDIEVGPLHGPIVALAHLRRIGPHQVDMLALA